MDIEIFVLKAPNMSTFFYSEFSLTYQGSPRLGRKQTAIFFNSMTVDRRGLLIPQELEWKHPRSLTHMEMLIQFWSSFRKLLLIFTSLSKKAPAFFFSQQLLAKPEPRFPVLPSPVSTREKVILTG